MMLFSTKTVDLYGLIRAALRLVRARVLCQMRAPYRPITAQKIFHSHQLRAPKRSKTAGPGAAAPLTLPLMRHWV